MRLINAIYTYKSPKVLKLTSFLNPLSKNTVFVMIPINYTACSIENAHKLRIDG